jgi:aminoglycoside phosphotransferase family enzyme/adenylate kinase family enzyme
VRYADVAETHSAAVFFFGDRAYKVKKPFDLGFLDFTERTTREATCHREVDLNRRLAPDIYLGVADVTDPDGQICDHLVVMRRLPEDRRLSTMIRRGEDVERPLWALAHDLATFHAGAARGPAADRQAGIDATRARWVANAAVLTEQVGDVFDDLTVGRVHGLAHRYLDGRTPLFDARIARGRACDGHGDLLADDIFCLDDGPRVLDCIEFDDDLRLGDALADVAFLAMDLDDLGRPDLAGTFLAAYAEHAADTWPASLAHHHIAYRAQVRAKVTAIRAGQGDATAAEHARRLIALALAHLEAGRVRLVLVGGLPGTGKSTICAGIAEQFPTTVLRSDVIRKELVGLPANRPAPAAVGEGIYDEAVTTRTYETMLQRTSVALAHGESVVLDASWTDPAWRAAARRLADAASSDLVELRCVAPVTVTHERMYQRAGTEDPSDATPEVTTAMTDALQAWPEAVTIDNRGDVEDAVEAALDEVDPAR